MPCQKLPAVRLAVGMYLLMMFCAVGSRRVWGRDSRKSAPLTGSTGATFDCEKSPARSSAVGTMALFGRSSESA